MKMFLVAAMALVSTSAMAIEVRTPARGETYDRSTEWVGYSASPSGRVFQSRVFDNEQSAKNSTRSECSSTSLYTCNFQFSTIAVAPSSFVAAINCGRKESFIGGSNIDMGAALWMATNKAKSRNWSTANCRQVFDSE